MANVPVYVTPDITGLTVTSSVVQTVIKMVVINHLVNALEIVELVSMATLVVRNVRQIVPTKLVISRLLGVLATVRTGITVNSVTETVVFFAPMVHVNVFLDHVLEVV